MRLNSKELSKAVRYALYAGAATAVGLTAAPVFAQSDSAGSEKLETIVVTGSRIRKADIETSQPIFVIDRAQIEKQGFASVSDILLRMTSMGSAPVFGRNSPLSSGEGAGGSYIDMRDLGATRTLILINGKRLGTTNDGLQDVASIPAGVVERIEVLKDGASSTYGSDAIAGVVNIITRTRFDGAEANLYVGQYDEDDGEKQSYDFTLGSTSERGSVTMSASYSKEDPVWARDRPFSATGRPGHGMDNWSAVTQNGVLYDMQGRMLTLKPGGDPTNINDFAPITRSQYANSNQQMMLQTGMERTSLYVSGSYAVTDAITFKTDALYNRRESAVQVAGYPLQGVGGPSPTALGMSPYSYYNPLGFWHNPDFDADNADDYTGYFLRRGWEVPRLSTNILSTYRFTGGFEGYFDVGDHTWNWDVGYLYNKNDGSQRQTGNFNLINTNNALGPSFLNADGIVQCGTPTNPIPLGFGSDSVCMPFNPLVPFGVNRPGSAADPNVRDYIYTVGQALAQTRTIDYTANLTGTIFALPAGDLAFAVGYEHRQESGFFSPDAFAQTGYSTDLASGPTQGRYSLDEYYAELSIPVVKDLPFARELTLEVAGRHTRPSTFETTTNFKYGLKWKPIDDLLVRATYADGFRAPTIGDLYGGVGQSFAYFTDPCDTLFGDASSSAGCRSGIGGQPGVPVGFRQPGQGGTPCTGPDCQSPVPFLSGSNPLLTPETSTSKTVGIVYSPSYLEGFDISVDWYNIRIENLISADSPDGILYDCYVRQIASRCTSVGANSFTRDPVTGQITAMSFAGRNLGYIKVQGYDIGLRYRLPETSIGRFVVSWETSYLDYWNSNSDPSDPESVESPSAGWSYASGTTFRTKSNLNVDWSLGDFGITYGARYFSGSKERCVYDRAGGPECDTPIYTAPDLQGANVPVRHIGSQTFHDLQFRYNAPWDATISVGANNVFGHVAPVQYSNPGSQYAYNTAFDIGRFYYMRYQQRF